MARVLDLNSIQQSLMDLTLQDDARTVVHLDIPNEGLINELQQIKLDAAKMTAGDDEALQLIYDLAARLINCNSDYFQVTGEGLRKKYGMSEVSALTFFKAYMGAIEELCNAKN